MRKKTRPRAETVRKAAKKRARAPSKEPGTPAAARAAKAAQRPGGGAVQRQTAGSSRSETGFDWLTDDDYRAFGAWRRLSKRQIDVMILSCRDTQRRVIARLLGLHRHTVDTHIARLHKKLDVKDAFEIRVVVEQFKLGRR